MIDKWGVRPTAEVAFDLGDGLSILVSMRLTSAEKGLQRSSRGRPYLALPGGWIHLT